MFGKVERRGVRLWTLTAIVLYGLVMSAGPFFYHDFACHQNVRTHCTSCVSSQSAHKVELGSAIAAATPHVVWRMDAYASIQVETPALSSFFGRSPPFSLL